MTGDFLFVGAAETDQAHRRTAQRVDDGTRNTGDPAKGEKAILATIEPVVCHHGRRFAIETLEVSEIEAVLSLIRLILRKVPLGVHTLFVDAIYQTQ